MKKSFLAALLASTMLAAGAAAPAAFAQQEGAAMQQPVPVDSAAVTDEQIRSYLTAAQGVNLIAQSYQPQLEAAESQEAAMAIQQEAQEQMLAVVQQAGLTADEYNAIVAGSQSDPELAERIESEAASMTGQPQ